MSNVMRWCSKHIWCVWKTPNRKSGHIFWRIWQNTIHSPKFSLPKFFQFVNYFLIVKGKYTVRYMFLTTKWHCFATSSWRGKDSNYPIPMVLSVLKFRLRGFLQLICALASSWIKPAMIVMESAMWRVQEVHTQCLPQLRLARELLKSERLQCAIMLQIIRSFQGSLKKHRYGGSRICTKMNLRNWFIVPHVSHRR